MKIFIIYYYFILFFVTSGDQWTHRLGEMLCCWTSQSMVLYWVSWPNNQSKFGYNYTYFYFYRLV